MKGMRSRLNGRVGIATLIVGVVLLVALGVFLPLPRPQEALATHGAVDLTGDGHKDSTDLLKFAVKLQPPTPDGRTLYAAMFGTAPFDLNKADVNHNGVVDYLDLNAWSQAVYGQEAISAQAATEMGMVSFRVSTTTTTTTATSTTTTTKAPTSSTTKAPTSSTTSGSYY